MLARRGFPDDIVRTCFSLGIIVTRGCNRRTNPASNRASRPVIRAAIEHDNQLAALFRGNDEVIREIDRTFDGRIAFEEMRWATAGQRRLDAGETVAVLEV